MAAILDGAATPAQIAGFIVALRMKGETVEELSGLLRSMLAASERVRARPGRRDRHRRHRRRPAPLDQRVHPGRARGRRRRRPGVQARQPGRLVVVRVGRPARGARRGHRARPRRAWPAASHGPASGSASRRASTRRCATPGPTRRELGVPTVFNFLGPLANPARVRRYVVGVSDPTMAERMARVLADHGAERAWIVHGGDGLDEITTTTGTNVVELDGGDGAHAGGRPRLRSASVRPAWPTCAAAIRRSTPAWRSGCSPATPGTTATSSCSTRPPASWSPGIAADMAEGVEAAPCLDRRRPGGRRPRPAGRRVRRRPHRGLVGAPSCGLRWAQVPVSRPASASMVRSSARAASRASSWRASSSMALPWWLSAGGVRLVASSSDSRDTSRSTSLTCSARRRRASVALPRGEAGDDRQVAVDGDRFGFELVGQLGGPRQLAAGGGPAGDHAGDGHRRPQPAVEPGRPRRGGEPHDRRVAPLVGAHPVAAVERAHGQQHRRPGRASPLRTANPSSTARTASTSIATEATGAAPRRLLAARRKAAAGRARRGPDRSGPAVPATPPGRATRRCT